MKEYRITAIINGKKSSVKVWALSYPAALDHGERIMEIRVNDGWFNLR